MSDNRGCRTDDVINGRILLGTGLQLLDVEKKVLGNEVDVYKKDSLV